MRARFSKSASGMVVMGAIVMTVSALVARAEPVESLGPYRNPLRSPVEAIPSPPDGEWWSEEEEKDLPPGATRGPPVLGDPVHDK